MKALLKLTSILLVTISFLALAKISFAQEGEKCTINNLTASACKDKVLIPTTNICSNTQDCITWFVNVIFLIAMTLAFVYLLWAGIDYILAGGEDPKAAQTKMTNAVIGLIIVIVSWAILNFIISIFGEDMPDIPVNDGKDKTPSSMIEIIS